VDTEEVAMQWNNKSKPEKLKFFEELVRPALPPLTQCWKGRSVLFSVASWSSGTVAQRSTKPY